MGQQVTSISKIKNYNQIDKNKLILVDPKSYDLTMIRYV